VSDQIFRRTWQSALIASCFSLSACGGGGEEGGGSGGRYQSISFDYPGGVTLAAGPAKLKATSDSGLPVSFRSETPATCTVSGDQLTLVSAGECLVVASQPGGASPDGQQWAPADDTSQLFNVLKHPQLVTFTPPDYVLSASTSSVALTATAESGLPVTFSTTTPDVCSITGTTLQLNGKGSCAVVATQGGDDTYSPQTTQRFIAVDPLIVADGFTPGTGGRGSSNSMSTKQGGGVTANPWGSPLGAGWEWCDGNAGGDWCYRTVSADGSSMTSALDIPDSKYSPGGWQYSFNRIDIFAPGLTGFNGSGDTTGGLQVTTEKALVFTLGVNKTLYTSGKPIVVHLDLGKSNGSGCNVRLSAHLWPAAAGSVSYSIPLGDFAVTDACGLAGVTQASLDDDVRKVPSPWPTPANPNALAQYRAALDTFTGARTSAMNLLLSATVVRTRFWLMDVNVDTKPDPEKDIPAPTPDELTLFSSRLTISGAITIQ
jgi:hypothetical protein